ncbi:MAG: insulinase family protein [Armatimonadetes bacterium]|nr:insulinase family protein [Armatimonadota bacterium]
MSFETTGLSNGLPVVVSPAPGTPRTAVCIAIRGGSRTEAQPGVAGLAARLLLKGTPSRSAERIADEMDRRAIDLDEISGSEHMMLRATFLNSQLEPALDLMADILQHSTFADLPKEAARLAGEIQASLDQPVARARDLFVRSVFPGHPYGHTGSLVLKSLPGLDVEGVRGWYRRQLGAGNMNVVVVGDVDPDAVVPALEARLGGIAPGGEPSVAPAVSRVVGPVIATEVKAEAHQAQIYQGWYTRGHGHLDRAPLSALNTLLGAGGLSCRLFVELRDKRGLAYTVRSGFSTFADVGLFSLYIGTSAENIRRALEGFAEQMARVRDEAILPDELAHAQGHLQGEFVLGHETNTQRCTDFAVHHILGLGLDFTARFLEEVLATRPEDLQRIAQEYLSPEPVAAVVATREALAAAGLGSP